MMKFLRHLFLPHYSNNQRAKLLHHETLLFLAIFLFFATAGLSFVKNHFPSVLGTSANISTQDLLVLTNQERAKAHVAPLTENDALATAAYWKGQDMFAHNYWAHVDPANGKTPWVFIQDAGYSYTFAGENLARGFGSAPDVVAAWIASPSHRENMLSPNYQEVGFSVQEGNLTGEQGTILVVQMFGGKAVAPLQKQTTEAAPVGKVEAAGQNTASVQNNASFTKAPIVDRFSFAKNITQLLLILFIIIFVLDILLIERKKIGRLVGHNLDHIFYLGAILLFIIFLSSGTIF